MHSHGGTAPHVPRRLRRRATLVFVAVLVPMAVATVLGAVRLWPHGETPTIQTDAPGSSMHAGVVTRVDPGASDQVHQLQARIDGHRTAWVNVPPEYLPELSPGDRIQVIDIGEVGPEGTPYVFVDYERGPPLAALAVGFVVLVVVVARWRGLAALVGLVVSLGVIGVFTLPALLHGKPPAPVALVTASAIMFVVLYLAHGVSLRTSTALLGTLVGLVATTALAAWASGAAQLTGLSDEYALDLMSAAPEVRIRAVLLCGMVLAGLGVLNDVTITQASAVWELHASAPDATGRTLFGRSMRIGRDHIASTVYTMVFAYVGATLPLVMLVTMSDRTLLASLTNGELAEEVARTLVGSIGLVLAIPLTTLVAVLVVRSGRDHAPRRAVVTADQVPAEAEEVAADPVSVRA
ncbi:YibE/F family protein [Cellulomonas sp. HZM]|uniref:YibE/F family protein n=1 Tax=Cellulomonas sp. HZM TaxID=1454010 RepID=UPI00068BD363|nr:YibE/F family protein [Cellulomonas sp. HZM]